ncbi:MAG: hypothetical protein CMC19_10855 [Flavobacteriaceae bacterium]|nr:hypothetical protein [Flavobacteriaceae bacterium]
MDYIAFLKTYVLHMKNYFTNTAFCILCFVFTLQLSAMDDFEVKEPITDVVILANGESIQGEIVKFSANSLKIKNDDGILKIKNNEIGLIALAQELTAAEKYQLGILDGKRYALNKGGNLAVGFFFGLIGTAVVYVSSDQLPSYQAANGAQKAIANDINYIQGYEKGARSKSGSQALIGNGILVLLYGLSLSGV